MKQKWWILLTLLLCGCGASSQPDQTGAVQNDRPRLSASTEETAENVAAVEKNENLEKNPSNSNQNPGEGQNWTVFAMDTVMQFDAYGGSANLQEKVKRRVEELEGELSTTQENSDIFHLNQEKTAELSADTRYLMQEALALGAETDGALDISIYPVVQSWALWAICCLLGICYGSRTRRSGWQSLRQNTIFPCSENALPCMLPLRFQARCLFL